MTASFVPEDNYRHTMWIVHTGVASANSATESVGIRHAEHTDGDYVEFVGDSGKLQVTKDVGEQLIEHYDDIEAAGTTDYSGDGDVDDEADSDDTENE